MFEDTSSQTHAEARRMDLVPRMKAQGYQRQNIDSRREWLEKKTGSRLSHVGRYSISSENMRGNIENPIGAAQIPIGVAGPLLISGTYANGSFYVPLATSEGALVRSYERGMVTLSRAGGVRTHVHIDENRMSPIFSFEDTGDACDFCNFIHREAAAIRVEAESTTHHGRLLRLECFPIGRKVIVNFCYFTADAQGMNMIVKATEQACKWIMCHSNARHFYIFSGFNLEKHASALLFSGGKGKKVTAGALVPGSIVKAYLHTTPEQLLDMWHHTLLGHIQGNILGYNGHYANGLTAIFIACGQDVANVMNSAVGITHFELTDAGDLYASVTLPSLTVATVGGGTGLGTGRECLELLGCGGSGGAVKFAEIVAGTLLAGEISMGAAIASGEFVQAHETYGRNRPGGMGPDD